MGKESINSFEIEIFSLGEKFNEILTKGRARIFYKGQNRNHTYITEEFANKLLATVIYCPVKGIWLEEEEDFFTHGEERTEGKIYGIVPVEHNFAWEEHLDKDGNIRNYACVDVLVYTGIYPEANKIIGKPLSMELFPPSIKGSWVKIDNEMCFKYTDASFAGLQVLGEKIEPCFEGAAYYSWVEDYKNLYTQIIKSTLCLEQGGHTKMPEKINFKLSDGDKFDLIWKEVNPLFNEENDWVISCSVGQVYDNYAVCYNYEEKEYFRLYFEKNEDNLDFKKREKCYMMDVTEEEKSTLEKLAALNGTYVQVGEKYESMSAALDELTNNYNTATASLQNIQEELNSMTEKYNLQVDKTNEVQGQLDNLQTEFNLKDDKINELTTIVNSVKEEMINKFALKLGDETVNIYREKLETYSLSDLEKELSYELVKATPNLFNLEPGSHYIPKDNPATGIEAILEKYV